MIARDIQRQNRAAPPAPLSDAYLAGIPNKRRKLAEGNRPNTNPQLLLQGIVLAFLILRIFNNPFFRWI